jgi:putative ABC transport system permease protein
MSSSDPRRTPDSTPLPRGIRRLFRLAARRRPPSIERDVDDEIAFHLEMRAAELASQGGLTPRSASAEAVRRFGDTRHWSQAMSAVDRERYSEEARSAWLDDLRQDIRFAARAWLRTPLFTLLAILTLALGIGANAAVFGIVKSVLLNDLPFTDADRIGRVYARLIDGTRVRGPLSTGTAYDIAARQHVFSRTAAFAQFAFDAVYATGDGPRVVSLGSVEPGFFSTLGVPAALGRTFGGDDAMPDTARVVILTHGLWQRLFAADPGILGKAVRINDVPRTVVGVLPRGFVGPVRGAELYMPLSLAPTMRDPIRVRRQHWLGMVGRLKPGVTVDAATRDVAAIMADLAREHPLDNVGITAGVVPVRDALVGDTRMPLLVLMASAGLVLLITCANLAGALLSRTLSRRKELAVRVALGAGRGRLVRQLLTESTLLALAGGAAGIVLATLGLQAARGLGRGALPEYANLSLDLGALAVTALVAIGTGLLFGAAPALAAGKTNVQGTLRDEARGASEGRRSRDLRGVLVAGQIALCVSLLAGAGLLGRSLWAMLATPMGFEPTGVLAMPVQLPASMYPTVDARARFLDRLQDRLRALPGVAAVSIAGNVPTRVASRNGFVVEGKPLPPGEVMPMGLITQVSDDYFESLGIPIRAGRAFDATDRLGGTPVVMISETLARRHFPAGNAVGGRLQKGADVNGPWFTVVGVVADVRNDPSQAQQEVMLYSSIRQEAPPSSMVVLRTRGDPRALAKAAQHELSALDPNLPTYDATTLQTVLSDGLAGRRLPVVLMTGFGALALLLASVGVYAMFAAMAAAREREFGVRVALGSTRRGIAMLVLRQGGAWMAAGLAGGAVGIGLVAQVLRGLLFGVAPFDPIVIGGAVVVLIACATIALLVPVRRATRVDPISVLR